MTLDITGWVCPLPLRDSPTIVMGHGGGGAMSAELIHHLFLPALAPAAGATQVLADLGDSAVVGVAGMRLAMSTDSYVVRPMFFPGGSIGDLAVNGTVNDIAMSGAAPLYLTAGFILEEGTAVEVVGRVAEAMGVAARTAGVTVVTGDTKVVDAGHGDGVYVTTAGVGFVPAGVDIGPSRARPGDVVIVSGAIGMHGIAVMSVRDGLEFESQIRSDTAALHGLVAAMIEPDDDGVRPGVRVLRDPTRGGLAASLNEIAAASGVGVDVVERSVPVPAHVANACGFLGLDPWYVANEGKLVAFVAPEDAADVLERMRAHPLGAEAAVIGECVEEHPGMVVAHTAFGATRVVDLPIGEQLPRIC
mgnify:CR=1 FL=1